MKNAEVFFDFLRHSREDERVDDKLFLMVRGKKYEKVLWMEGSKNEWME